MKPELWNCFDDPEDRTTNRVEGFHLKLNRLLNTANPNLYLLINVFKKLETENAIKMLAVADETFVPRRLPANISKDEGIELVKEEFSRQSSTVSEFFKKMCAVAGKYAYTMSFDLPSDIVEPQVSQVVNLQASPVVKPQVSPVVEPQVSQVVEPQASQLVELHASQVVAAQG